MVKATPMKPKESMIKVPMPGMVPLKTGIQEMSAEDRLKELEKTQQEKEKKFFEEMMKKRNSKIISFRQSKNPMGLTGLKRNQDIEVDFLKGL